MPEDYLIKLDEVQNPNAWLLEGKKSSEGEAEKPADNKTGEQSGNNPGGDRSQGGEADPAKQSAKPGNQYEVRRFNFVVQLAWIPRTPAERVKARAERLEKEKAEAAAAAGAAGQAAPGNAPAAPGNPAAPAAVPPAGVPSAPPAGVAPQG